MKALWAVAWALGCFGLVGGCSTTDAAIARDEAYSADPFAASGLDPEKIDAAHVAKYNEYLERCLSVAGFKLLEEDRVEWLFKHGTPDKSGHEAATGSDVNPLQPRFAAAQQHLDLLAGGEGVDVGDEASGGWEYGQRFNECVDAANAEIADPMEGYTRFFVGELGPQVSDAIDSDQRMVAAREQEAMCIHALGYPEDSAYALVDRFWNEATDISARQAAGDLSVAAATTELKQLSEDEAQVSGAAIACWAETNSVFETVEAEQWDRATQANLEGLIEAMNSVRQRWKSVGELDVHSLPLPKT